MDLSLDGLLGRSNVMAEPFDEAGGEPGAVVRSKNLCPRAIRRISKHSVDRLATPGRGLVAREPTSSFRPSVLVHAFLSAGLTRYLVDFDGNGNNGSRAEVLVSLR
jgi:hypothetical protein